MKFNFSYWRELLQGCLVLSLFFSPCALLLAGSFGFSLGNQGPIDQPAETEYYRGLYDVCIFFSVQSGVTEAEVVSYCLNWTSEARANDWYGLESIGWQWPLPDPSQ